VTTLLFFLLFHWNVEVESHTCPSNEKIAPCRCNVTHFVCDGNEDIDTKKIFHQLSTFGQTKNFDNFILNNTAINELPENFFEQIIFSKVFLVNATNLTRIHEHAFTATGLSTSYLEINNVSIDNQHSFELFTAISLMKNLNTLIIANTSITQIPKEAFRPLNGLQSGLSTVKLSYNKLKIIEDFAFKNLPELKLLDLSHNNLNYITENALKLLVPSTDSKAYLTIDLSDNFFNELSFAPNAFKDINKPATLKFLNSDKKLNNTIIKYLKQQIFQPFLLNYHENKTNPSFINKVEVSTLDCTNCDSNWLLTNEKFKNQLNTIVCYNGNKISDAKNFIGCS
jgi:hypothetical protein